MNRTRQSALVFFAGLALAATSLPALGQSSKSKGSQPAASSPATPPPASNPAGRKEPETGPFLTRDGLKEWNMVYTVTIHSDRVDQTKPHEQVGEGAQDHALRVRDGRHHLSTDPRDRLERKRRVRRRVDGSAGAGLPWRASGGRCRR
jgi:hypothetical protein